jgi:hypothetical protein
MNQDTQETVTIIVTLIAFVLIVWFLNSIIDAMKDHPEPVWLIIGVVGTVIAELLIYTGILVARRIRGDK